MSVQTSKKSYRRHEYSGQRKSIKRVRGGLRKFHDVESRSKVWRSEETKKPVCEEIIIDNSTVTQNTLTQPRKYAHIKPKICLEATYRAPSTTTVAAEPVVIQEDQTKILIAKVYHYLEQEYEELKTIYGDLDLTPLSKFRQRTALATGVSETTILQILKEEEGKNADKQHEPPEKRRRARKRSRQADRSTLFGDTG